MRKFSHLLCFVQLAAACHASLQKFSSRPQELPQLKEKYTGRVVGGELVENCSSYPYQVSIQWQSSITQRQTHFCGGSIISEHFILTAGHCVIDRSAASILVIAGTHKLDTTGQEGVRRNASNIIVHEEYSPGHVDFDVALIKLKQPLNLSSDCESAISLPAPNEEIIEGTMCVATGWGAIAEGGPISPTLRVVNVPIVSQKTCRQSYGEAAITDRMICAGFPQGGKDTCQGDSGGPLACDGKLIGTVSWGNGCARPQYYGVLARVPYFIDWINVHITAN